MGAGLRRTCLPTDVDRAGLLLQMLHYAALHTHRGTPIPHMQYERVKSAREREKEKEEREIVEHLWHSSAAYVCVSCVCMYQLRTQLIRHASCPYVSIVSIRNTPDEFYDLSLALALTRARARSLIPHTPSACSYVIRAHTQEF